MSKELPYFKFEPNEWDNGNIQVCSRQAKGLFIDLCAMYWSRLGELPYALALQKHCNGDASLLQELQENSIIIIDEGQIIIKFLDEQLSNFHETSQKRRDAANKRWGDANALQMQSKSNAIKRREEKKKEEKKKDNIYREFDHLKITDAEFEKLLGCNYTKDEVDSVLDSIENYKGNSKYKSLYLTANKWLKNQYGKRDELPTKKEPSVQWNDMQRLNITF